jgi:phosphoserine phosphatase
MTHVATLICNPRVPVLTLPVAERVRALLEGAEPAWLAEDVAADIPFTLKTPHPSSAAALIRSELAPLPIDCVVQANAHRRKRLLVADMDSTMIAQECIDELADFAGLKPQVAAITERAMRGELAFEPALRERVALLKDLSVDVIATVLRERIRLTAGGRELVQTMRAHGAHTCLVSGGFMGFVDKIGAMLGFDETRGNVLLTAGGKLAGAVQEPILGREAKLAALIELRERFGIDRNETLAVGDGANDLAMIQEAGLGVAFHAKPVVAEAAAARIDHGDLTALLYAQGYRNEEFSA